MASSAYPASASSSFFDSKLPRRGWLTLLALAALPGQAPAADAPALLLAQVYRPGLPLQDYWVSEKYDGVRG
ncbi:MAG: ligase 1, partial [Pseudomonadota bacterium]|nr:ligase 1 [Pseudomonadota bacterium]